jgi:energy-coupling factor transporter ATP-binding protein EcfA2
MAHLKKLAIRGVRSFSPDDEQTMEFQTPLTMIVGHNGCGKTTIIECLKYACTGVLPPGCSRGQAFVHDPKYSGTTEVKASIKLRFANSMAEPMVVVRAMSLTQSKTRMTFKALDGTIRTHGADGSNKSASHKCIDLDKNIPGYLGVPRSILENVIFCHQEESSWPLQEGAVVKKKFDDIFESTRYTKALDAIKKSSKECNEKSKELKIELAELNANMGAAVQFMEELESQKAKKSKYEARAKEDADSLAEIESSLAALEKQSEQVLSVRLQRKQVQSSLSNLSVQIQENERHLPKLLDSESDENLQEYLDDFDSLLATIKQEYEKQAGLEGEVKQSLEAAKEQRNRLHQSRGALEAMMEDEDRKRNAQRATADRLALEYDLVAAQLDPPGIASALAEKVKKLRTLLVTTREAAHKREGELQREASTLQAQYESGKGVRTSRAKEVAEVEARVRQARMDVQRLQQRAVGLPSLEEASQKAAAAREALDKFTSDMTTKELKDKITAAQKEIAGLDVDIRNDDYAISAARESAGEQRDLATALTTIEQDKAKLATDVTTVAVDGLDALLDFPLPHGEDAVNLETLITAVEQLKFKEARCDEEVKKARESAGRASNEAALKEGEVKRLTLAAQKAQADLQKLVDSGVEQNVVDSVAAIEAMRKKNEEEYNQGFATRPPPPFGRSALSDGIKFIRDLRAVKDKELSEYAGRAAFYTSIKENVEAKMMAHEHLGKCHLCRRELDADAARKTLQVAEKNANDERAVEIREVRDQAQACLQKAELLVDPWTALLKLRPEVDEKKRAVATAEEEAKAAQVRVACANFNFA